MTRDNDNDDLRFLADNVSLVATDGIGVQALVAAAHEVQNVLDGHNVNLGAVSDTNGDWIMIVTAKNPREPLLGGIVATVEDNPTLVRIDTT